MPNIIYEYTTEEGQRIFIEGEEKTDPYAGYRDEDTTREFLPDEEATRGLADKITKKVNMSFEKALGTVKAAAKGLKKVIDEVNPDEASVEFSVKTQGEVGFFTICKAATDAEFKVTLKWTKDKAPKSV